MGRREGMQPAQQTPAITASLADRRRCIGLPSSLSRVSRSKPSRWQEQESAESTRLTQHALDDLNDFSGHYLRLELSDPLPDTAASQQGGTALTIRLLPGESTTSSLDPHSPIPDITYPQSSIPSPSSSSPPRPGDVRGQRAPVYLGGGAGHHILSPLDDPFPHRPAPARAHARVCGFRGEAHHQVPQVCADLPSQLLPSSPVAYCPAAGMSMRRSRNT